MKFYVNGLKNKVKHSKICLRDITSKAELANRIYHNGEMHPADSLWDPNSTGCNKFYFVDFESLRNACDDILSELTSDQYDETSHIIDDDILTSLSFMEAIMSIEEEFDIEIEDERFNEITTIKDLYEIVEEKLCKNMAI